MPTHPDPPLRRCPAPRVGLPPHYGARKKSADDRLYEKLLGNLLKTAIAIIVMVLVFKGIVQLMDSKKLPLLKVSQEAMHDDGQFTISTEYGFVREAYQSNGEKMTLDELKKLAQQPEPKFNFELVDPTCPSQW